jgi:hypothetical protein
MRAINEHKVNPANDQIFLTADDAPGQGGANHAYTASLPNGINYRFDFQNGPINEVGVNGLTHEVLLAILVDRMRGFQSGPYACTENALALASLEMAQHYLHSRTRARMERGVEGTHTV